MSLFYSISLVRNIVKIPALFVPSETPAQSNPSQPTQIQLQYNIPHNSPRTPLFPPPPSIIHHINPPTQPTVSIINITKHNTKNHPPRPTNQTYQKTLHHNHPTPKMPSHTTPTTRTSPLSNSLSNSLLDPEEIPTKQCTPCNMRLPAHALACHDCGTKQDIWASGGAFVGGLKGVWGV
ncbi:hypothetical protein M501DRAFT_1018617 [Patellaria atrata CBS 101060]|uniref:Uncharacterized protein n=1 Tax=Patellaria atrata CBS 101060 TaxID=1346257 RepID=A0A9P4S688_9PEZI|nr:hypothetical protein M501DRAFT_1018617 [Patellaria atrata CBS 101060]